MSRKIALPLLVAAALVSIILASRTPQPIIEELPPEEADAPTALLTQTEEVGDQTVTLRVYEPDEAGYARYALFGADGAEIDIPFGVNCGTWIGNGNAAEKVSLTARDDVLGFPGFELETIQGIVMTVCDFYALTEQGFVYAGRTVGYDFGDAAEGDGACRLISRETGAANSLRAAPLATACRVFLSTVGTPRRGALSAVRSTGIRRTRSLRA